MDEISYDLFTQERKRRSKKMASLKDAAERQAFSLAIDATLKSLNKDREKGLLNIVNLAQKFMGSNFRSEAYEGAKKMIQNPDSKWMRYVNRLLDETDPHVAKMTALNLGYQAAFAGTKKIRKMREIENCNIPWLILMDPTSACNLHCTGCWAAEYGHKLNLTFDELDNIVTQGKELGVYFYMMTGGEPLVRKADIIRLCEKHNDCAFHCYTNGTLVDEKLCEDMKRVGNLSLSISLEGFEDANDFRRGEGVYNKVLHAMDLLHENGLIFGNSVCYTSKNMDAVTSDEFFDLLIEHGSRFAWYFHLMPVGMKASPELMPTKEQREYIYKALNDIPGISAVKPKAAFYIFPKIDTKKFNIYDDEKFALDLLREKKILIIHGAGFNWGEPDHFRVVYLPRIEVLKDAVEKMEDFLKTYKQR